MNLDFSGKTFTVKSWSDENFWEFNWSSAFNLNERALVDDVRHLLLLLFSFVNFLLQVGDLF